MEKQKLCLQLHRKTCWCSVAHRDVANLEYWVIRTGLPTHLLKAYLFENSLCESEILLLTVLCMNAKGFGVLSIGRSCATPVSNSNIQRLTFHLLIAKENTGARWNECRPPSVRTWVLIDEPMIIRAE